ncbi:alpha/beta fold hydrolase [Nakamurella sp. YIM 132087]|uniref:Alpha/beta fold hydrolase n=1 Tax=Nakamurella alba TaxID=2665158 RepID=A0A7K1FFU7_9ACTN|nr:alpha/beta fold hydrolase [Nakamurella alba]
MPPDETPGEFDFLAAEAAEVGRTGPLPAVRRVELELPDAPPVSGLLWGDGPPEVVLLHGAGLNAHTFDTTVLALGRPALVLDLPGHGRSGWRSDADYSPPTNAAAVIAALDAWTGGGVVLLGQSLGGLTALVVAARRPDLTRSLVMVDITPGVTAQDSAQVVEFLAGPSEFASRDEIVEMALRFGLGSGREALQRGVFHNTRIRPDGRVVFVHHFAHLGGLSPTVLSDRDRLWSAADEVVGAGIPVLLVRASDGFVSEQRVAEFRERVPAARVVQVQAGHNVQEQAAAALAALIPV